MSSSCGPALGGDGSPVIASRARHAVDSGEALLLAEAVETQPEIEARALRHGIRSASDVPRIADAGAIGVPCVDTPGPPLPFNAEDFQFVRAVGGLLATALAAERGREEVRRIETEARTLQARRDAIAGYVKIASHGLRDPLTVILLGARAIRVRPEADVVEKMTDTVVNASHRALGLIHTWLEMAALDAGQSVKLKREEVDVRRLVDEERSPLPARRPATARSRGTLLRRESRAIEWMRICTACARSWATCRPTP